MTELKAAKVLLAQATAHLRDVQQSEDRHALFHALMIVAWAGALMDFGPKGAEEKLAEFLAGIRTVN